MYAKMYFISFILFSFFVFFFIIKQNQFPKLLKYIKFITARIKQYKSYSLTYKCRLKQ